MNENALPADVIIDARWIAPVEPPGVVLQDHSLVISAGAITEIVPTGETTHHQAAQRHTLSDHMLIPGLVNLHTHAAMVLMRGLADDLPSIGWLRTHMWPAGFRTVSVEFVRDGALLACAEMLQAGITCFNDTYFFPEATAQAALRAGIRAALGIIVLEFSSAYGSDAADYLAKGLATRDALRDESLLAFCMAPHAPSDASLERVATYAAELDLPIHIRLHETQEEIRESVALHRRRPLHRLQDFGLLGPNLIAVHAVHLEPGEVTLLGEQGCHVAHCPVSNLKLASGIAPVWQLREAAVNVALGTGAAASNNRLDILSEMRLAALLAKGITGNPAALPAWQALEMATINGARALGLESRTGSLRAGKRADVVAINLAALELGPCYDPLSALVYAAGREHVSHVWIDGQLKVEQGRLVALDEGELKSKMTYWRDRMRTLA